jgi:protocatechuate 3,4-dioxygenase beta subunit
MTDGEGRFRVEAPEPGLWTAVADARGRVPMEHRLWPLLGPAELEPVELLPDVGLRVLVVDGAGRPLPGAVVAASGSGPRRQPYDRRPSPWRPAPDRVAATGEAGRARLARFEGEDVTLWAVAPGRSLRRVVEAAAAERPVRVVLVPGPSRRLRVTEPGGAPAAGAAVWLASPLPAGLTAEDGTIDVPLSSEDGGPEPVKVQIDAPSGRIAEIEVRPAPEGQEAPLAVELQEPPRVSGHVFDARERRGIAGALVWPWPDRGAAARADGSGAFVLPVRRPRAQGLVQVAAPGYLGSAARLPAAGPRSAEEILILLRPAVPLTGTVVDGAGQPIEAAEVRVMQTGDGAWAGSSAPFFSRSDRTGRFRVEGLGARAPHLAHVARRGYSPAVAEVAPAPERPDGRPGPLPELHVVLQPGRALRGRAVDEAGAPVAGARAVLFPQELLRRGWPAAPQGVLAAETDAEGRFELLEVLPGRAALLLSAPGRASAERDGFEILPDRSVTDLGDLVLEPEVFVEGRVVEPDGSPVVEASVAAARPPEQVLEERLFLYGERERADRVTTGPDGAFRIGALREGQVVRVEAAKEGYIDGAADGVRAPGEEPVVVVLRPAATISGRVVDARGRPVPEAAVRPSFRARLPGTGFFQAVTADDQGSFELTGVPPGLVALEAAAAGNQGSAPVVLELQPGERREGVEIVLEEGAAVTGRVLSPDGLPVAAAVVTATLDDGESFVTDPSELTGPDGRFTLDTLAPGRVVLEAHRDGYAPGRAELELDLGGATVDVQLERGALVSGWLLEPDGTPAGSRTLQLLLAGTHFDSRATVTTAADGSFVFRGVAAGEYRITLTDAHRPVWSAPETLTVQDGMPREGIEVRLPRLAAIAGRLLGLAPDQLRGVVVAAVKHEHLAFDERQGEVRDDGSYRVSELTPGRWQVNAVQLEIGRRAEGWITIEPGQAEAALDLELRGGHTLTGTVRQAGEPLAGARVDLSGSSGFQRDGATTDLAGRFRIEGIRAGQHMVVVRDPGTGAMVAELVQIDGDQDVLLEIESHRVAGSVYAADGSGPIAGATASLEPELELQGRRRFAVPSQTFSAADGAFLLGGVAAGRWRLVVEKPGYAAQVSTVEILGGDVEAAPVFLEPAGVLELRVRLADGRAPPSLVVVLMGAGERPATCGQPVPAASSSTRSLRARPSSS